MKRLAPDPAELVVGAVTCCVSAARRIARLFSRRPVAALCSASDSLCEIDDGEYDQNEDEDAPDAVAHGRCPFD